VRSFWKKLRTFLEGRRWAGEIRRSHQVIEDEERVVSMARRIA
jgi:hypothetical protein